MTCGADDDGHERRHKSPRVCLLDSDLEWLEVYLSECALTDIAFHETSSALKHTRADMIRTADREPTEVDGSVDGHAVSTDQDLCYLSNS